MKDEKHLGVWQSGRDDGIGNDNTTMCIQTSMDRWTKLGLRSTLF